MTIFENAVPQHLSDPGGAEGPSSTSSEALHLLCQYWRRLWHRPIDYLDTAADSISASNSSQIAPAKWEPLTLDDLRAAACRQKGRAGGLDGWNAQEITCFPPAMLQTLVNLMNRWEHLGCFPTIFQSLRQTHLAKPGKSYLPDGTFPASAMRPITISSMIWRMWTSARFRSASIQAWLSTWPPEACIGGLPSRSTMT